MPGGVSFASILPSPDFGTPFAGWLHVGLGRYEALRIHLGATGGRRDAGARRDSLCVDDVRVVLRVFPRHPSPAYIYDLIRYQHTFMAFPWRRAPYLPRLNTAFKRLLFACHALYRRRGLVELGVDRAARAPDLTRLPLLALTEYFHRAQSGQLEPHRIQRSYGLFEYSAVGYFDGAHGVSSVGSMSNNVGMVTLHSAAWQYDCESFQYCSLSSIEYPRRPMLTAQ